MNKTAKTAMALVLASMASVEPVQADQSNRARALVEECKNEEAACEEYLLGVWDAILMMQTIQDRQDLPKLICAEVGPNGGQLHVAFDKWVNENPEKLDKVSRVVGAMLAFKHVWPC